MNSFKNQRVPDTDLAPEYFCEVSGKHEGPLNLIELAAQLRYKHITLKTLIRRQGEDAWNQLQDLPEFPTLCEISIETIAWHVEEKARKAQGSDTSADAGFAASGVKAITILLTVTIGFVLLQTVLYEASNTSTTQVTASKASPAAAWVNTTGEAFSIECPVLLNRQNPKMDISLESYQASGSGFQISVEVDRVPPGIFESNYSSLINGMRDRLLRIKGRTIVSQHFISENGYNGVDVFFTDDAEGTKYEGGIRILAGSGRSAYAVYECDSDHLQPDDISRFLTSFRLF